MGTAAELNATWQSGGMVHGTDLPDSIFSCRISQSAFGGTALAPCIDFESTRSCVDRTRTPPPTESHWPPSTWKKALNPPPSTVSVWPLMLAFVYPPPTLAWLYGSPRAFWYTGMRPIDAF